MLIGYDGRFISERPTGNGVYAARLIESLSALDESIRYRLYVPGPCPPLPAGLGDNVDVRVMHPLHRSAWVRVPIIFPMELRLRPVDIFHAHYTIPPFTSATVVLTLHDFFWIVYPDYFVSFKRVPLTFTVSRAVKRAERILVGTSFIKGEAMERFGVPEERFKVIPYGVDERFFAMADRARLRGALEKYGIDGPYILAVGDIHPRKNLERLLRAYAALPERTSVKLVLVGRPLWRTGPLFEAIKRAGLEDRVVTTGYVPDEDLPLLYQGSEVFCYPSLYEGFGFPIIEAMASGVPVATSATTSCPEVGGDGAVYFDPEDVDSMVDALHRILTDSVLRARLVRSGGRRAKLFTWEDTARRTMDVYRELC